MSQEPLFTQVSTNTEADTEISIHEKAPGHVLALARERAKMTQQEVAACLRLTPDIIAAIDRDDYSSFQVFTFLRGYLRAYAKLVSVDPETTIRSFDNMHLIEEENNRPRLMPVAKRQVTSSDRRVKWATYSIIVILGALLILWWQNQYFRAPAIDLTHAYEDFEGILEDPTNSATDDLDSAQVAISSEFDSTLNDEGYSSLLDLADTNTRQLDQNQNNN